MEVDAIKLTNLEPMMVTWDIGRRCNFDCTYCESTRHNTYSPPTSWNNLCYTLDFIKKYTSIYNQPNANIGFTGGEPTVNPKFWDFVEKINNETEFQVGLTSNGTWPEKHIDFIKKNFVGITLSYHAEANLFSKERTINNAILIHEAGLWNTVNVMMHTDHWNECVEVHEKLKSHGIDSKPTIIGDGAIGITDWFEDTEGVQRRTSHPYTKEQQQWYLKEKGLPTDIVEKISEGYELPRGCCGARSLQGSCNGCWQNVEAVNTNFKDWYCAVNKYFLHIDQHTGKVYHHQTCKATFSERVGAIGRLSNVDGILNYAFENRDVTIRCPNARCGCGMCVPKAKTLAMFKKIVG
jgi:MoaA/NifB/PqqE/SkfB family radical SAM enzyme